MNKRMNLILAVMLALAMVLSACAPAATPEPTQAPAPTAAPAQPTQPPAPTAEPTKPPAPTAEPTKPPAPTKAPEAVKIAVSFMASGTYDKAAADVAADLKGKGVDVTVAAFPWAVLRQNNTNQLIAGTAEYSAMSGSYYLADVYKFMKPVDDLIKKDNVGQGMIDGLMTKSEHSNGKQIGIPYGVDSYGLMYRTDLFKTAGMEAKFATWADFLKAMPALQAKLPKDVAPFVFAGGAGEQLPAVFFADYDGTYINKDGKFQLEADKAAAAIQVSNDILKFAEKGSKAYSVDEANAVFLSGKAAMVIGWPSFIRAAADDPAKSQVVGKWAQMEFPGKGFPWLSLWNIFVNSSAKNPDAAWAFVKAYTSEANALVFFNKYGIGSCYVSTYQNADVLAKHGHDLPNGMKNIARAKNPPLSGEAQDFFSATLGEMNSGKLTAKQAVDKINTKWATLTVPAAILESATNNGLVAK
jgi:ABC-type glycerol-3-phosphate transport system substrate-binding protein